MNEEQTRKFVDEWNIRNGYPLGEETEASNMRYINDGVISWNEYNAEKVDVIDFILIYNKIMI